MFYVKIMTLGFVFFASIAHAGDLLGEDVGNPNPIYRIQNENHEVIFESAGDVIQNVSLQDGYGVVQTIFQNVSWITENKNAAGNYFAVKDAYGSDYKVSDTLLAVYFANSVGTVYDRAGHSLYQNVHVQGMGVSHSYFGVVDSFNQEFDLYTPDQPKAAFFTRPSIQRASFSEGFIATIDEGNEFTLYAMSKDQSPTILASEGSFNHLKTSQLKISDQLAGYIDSTHQLRIYSPTGIIFTDTGVKDYGLNHSFFYVVDQFGLRFFDAKATLLYASAAYVDFTVSETRFAVRLPTHALVMGDASGNITQLNIVDRYVLTEKLLMVTNGPAEYSTYNFNSDGTTNLVFHELDQNIASFLLGEDTVAIQYQGLNSPTRAGEQSAKVVSVRDANADAAAVLFQANLVDHLSITQNREELNWILF